MRKIISNLFIYFCIGIICNSIYNGIFNNFFEEKQDNKTENLATETVMSDLNWEYSWYDYNNNYHSGDVTIRQNDLNNSIKNKKNKWYSTDNWGSFYYGIYAYDKHKLDLFYPMLDRIWNNYNLTRKDFLNIIMSFTQGIEYNVPIMGNCNTEYHHDSDIRELINQGYPCESYVTGAIYTPLEFLGNVKGDCDTRTVFLYTILKRYNYDVVILNSDVYGHSILGVNIPSSGRYKYYNGKRYYTWETTAYGWRLGQLPPGYSNINYWHVAL